MIQLLCNNAVILSNKNLCYYHNPCRYEYWNITDANQEFFANHTQFTACPFRGGLNQLWRNQLLGLGIEQDPRQDYRQVYFSVVKHPRNAHLDRTLNTYQELIAHNSKFSVFTSADVIAAAARFADAGLVDWIEWYTELYDL